MRAPTGTSRCGRVGFSINAPVCRLCSHTGTNVKSASLAALRCGQRDDRTKGCVPAPSVGPRSSSRGAVSWSSETVYVQNGHCSARNSHLADRSDQLRYFHRPESARRPPDRSSRASGWSDFLSSRRNISDAFDPNACGPPRSLSRSPRPFQPQQRLQLRGGCLPRGG